MEPPHGNDLLWKAFGLIVTALSSSGFTVWLMGKQQGKQEAGQENLIKAHERRLKTLENSRSGLVTLEACKTRHSGCKDFQAAQLAHGSDEFKEIKQMMMDQEKANQDRHNLILNHLLQENRNGRG